MEITISNISDVIDYFESDTDQKTGTCNIDIGGETKLPVKLWPSPGSNKLLITFHGAINRQKRVFPAYFGFQEDLHHECHQIQLADTSLMENTQITMGWFAGSKRTPLQQLLPSFFETLVKRLNVKRTVFLGSSSGGYAALFYSHKIPGSTAIAKVPQTSITRYYPSHVERYVKAAWGTESEMRRSGVISDVRELYRSGVPNRVVYVQSMDDSFHLINHMKPFVSQLSLKGMKNVALECSFWGVPKHSGAVPVAYVKTWLRAALQTDDVHSLITKQWEYRDGWEMAMKTKALNKGPRTPKQTINRSEELLTMNDRLSMYLLND